MMSMPGRWQFGVVEEKVLSRAGVDGGETLEKKLLCCQEMVVGCHCAYAKAK
jgi:hypothetical protein